MLIVFDNGNKAFNIYKGLPVGAIAFGPGSIGQSSMESLVKGFRRLIGTHPPIPNRTAAIDHENDTVKDIAKRFGRFIYDERYVAVFKDYAKQPAVAFIIAGYSTDHDLGEEYPTLNDQAHVTAPNAFAKNMSPVKRGTGNRKHWAVCSTGAAIGVRPC